MIYVDDMFMQATAGRVSGRWCHLFAYPVTPENLEILHEFAAGIGMRRAWFQNKSTLPHYDLVESRRKHAVAEGAVQVSYWKDLAKFIAGTWPHEYAAS